MSAEGPAPEELAALWAFSDLADAMRRLSYAKDTDDSRARGTAVEVRELLYTATLDALTPEQVGEHHRRVETLMSAGQGALHVLSKYARRRLG